MSNLRVVHPRITRYASLPLETLFHDLQTSPQGYSSRQAAQSRERYGQNQYTAHQTDTVLFRIRRAFVNPFSLILTVLAIISFCTDVVFASNYSRNITTCLLIVGMLLLSGIVRFTQELRAKQATDHLFSLIHTTVQTRRDGQWQELPCEELVVGDLVRIQAGERVPADLRLTTAKDLFVSQSVLTGESAVLEKNSAPLPASGINNLLDYTNIAFSGSTVIGGSGQGIVLAVGKDTVYGDVGATPAKKSGFDRGANSIAQVLIRFMAVLVPLVFLACGLTKDNWGAAFLFALSVAVGLTPEMLPMVINACLAKGSVAMEKKETIVKNINAMQSFGSMDVLCVDKTGTLTGDRIVLEYYLDILGNESSEVLDYAYLNSLYHTGVQNHLDQAIRKAETLPGKQQSFAALAARCPKLDELPFDYERRFASVLVQDGSQYRLIVKGDVQEVCRRCTQVAYRGQYSPMQPGGMKHVHEVVDEMTEDGMKVLAVATKLLPSSQLSADETADIIGLTARHLAKGIATADNAIGIGVVTGKATCHFRACDFTRGVTVGSGRSLIAANQAAHVALALHRPGSEAGTYASMRNAPYQSANVTAVALYCGLHARTFHYAVVVHIPCNAPHQGAARNAATADPTVGNAPFVAPAGDAADVVTATVHRDIMHLATIDAPPCLVTAQSCRIMRRGAHHAVGNGAIAQQYIEHVGSESSDIFLARDLGVLHPKVLYRTFDISEKALVIRFWTVNIQVGDHMPLPVILPAKAHLGQQSIHVMITADGLPAFLAKVLRHRAQVDIRRLHEIHASQVRPAVDLGSYPTQMIGVFHFKRIRLRPITRRYMRRNAALTESTQGNPRQAG